MAGDPFIRARKNNRSIENYPARYRRAGYSLENQIAPAAIRSRHAFIICVPESGSPVGSGVEVLLDVCDGTGGVDPEACGPHVRDDDDAEDVGRHPIP